GLGNLVAAINGDQAALGLTASLNVSNGTVALTQNTAGADVVVAGTGLTDNYATQFTTPASGSNSFGAQYMGGILTLHDGGNINNLGGNLTGTFTLENNDLGGKGDITDTFVMGGGSEVLAGDGGTVTVLGNSLNSLIQAVNDETNNAGSNLDITASLDTASGGLFLQSGSLTTTAVTVQSSGANHTLTDNVTETPTGGTGGSANAAGQVVFGNAGTNLFTDPVMGTITLTNSNSGNPEKATFTMDGSTGHTTLGDLQTLIDNAGIGLTASIGGTGLTVAVSGANYGNSLSETGSLADAFGVNLGASTTGQPAAAAQNASATVNTTAGNTIGTSDTIAGNLVVQNGAVKHTFIMGTGAGDIGGTTIGALAQAISNNVALGVTADVNPATHALELQANNPGTVLTATSNLNDTVPEAVTGSQNIGTLNTPSTTTLTLGSGTISSSDTITGTIALSANGNNVTFTMGATAAQALNSTASNVYINGTTLTDLESAIDSSTGQYGLNISATPNGSSLVLSSMVDNTTTIGVISNSLYDDFSNLASQASLGTFANVKDQVSGTISYSLGVTTPVAKSIPIAAGSSVQDMVNTINGATNNHPYGVTASLIPSGNGTFETVMLTSDTYGSDGQIEDTTGTSFVDSTTTATLSYKAGNAYDTGLSGGTISSGTAIYDSSSGQSNSLAGEAEIVSNSNGSSGVATISYSDGAGEALNSTDLTSQTDAETALNDLNVAISDVAAQDGYIGAQINTLNSISQVMSTQQENVVSAQNAIQATDYASATSNMSKYEILSQTGIAALAQANSVEQEVTKLLQ
ncbi:MAG: flagellin, partial [Terracidiphilus sp.]